MVRLLTLLIYFYRSWISPLKPQCCRYLPSCSEFAAEAVVKHGAWRGSLLALRRLLSCHPLGGHGLDPVPEHCTWLGGRIRSSNDTSDANSCKPTAACCPAKHSS
ncbi:MAG: membrane protein insertion efficiency factor YidD [Planctomycetota bacterium]|nr:MAG: membrane protein insertion efficiency factor YidD [Planctomycetota bacterium]